MDEANRDHTGKSIGPYRLERLLGRGGMGEVYLAYDRRLDRRVAIKRIKSSADDAKARQRFRREAWTVAHLSHPAVVQIFDILEEESSDWIVMEHVDGPTLAESSGPMSVDLVLEYGQQIAEGLAEAHLKDIVHRDLKSENVMLTPSGHVKILDFGLAKRLIDDQEQASLTRHGEILGTGRSMSPEQACGKIVDARSDLFSLGILLYELLIGNSPFRGKTLAETLTRVNIHQQMPVHELRADVPSELSSLIDRLLEKSPALRPATAKKVAEELKRLRFGSGESSVAAAATFEALPQQLQDYESAETFSATASAAGYTAPSAANMASAAARSTPESPREESSQLQLLRQPFRKAVVVALGILGLVGAGWWLQNRGSSSGETADESAAAIPAPLSPYELYQQGMTHLQRYDRYGQIDQAIEAFQRALEGGDLEGGDLEDRALDNRAAKSDDEYAPALAGLAKSYWLKYQWSNRDRLWLDRALATAERAVELDGYFVLSRLALASVYRTLGRADEAREQYDRAIELEPSNLEAYIGLGKLAEVQKDDAAAQDAYQRVAELAPDDRQALDSRGYYAFRNGRYEEAEALFLHSIEAAPDGIMARRNLSAVYHVQGKPSDASRVLQEALAIQPDPTLYSNLGTLLFFQGLFPQSVAAFEKALAFEGGANRYLMWANLGDAYRWSPGKENQARDAYRRAIQLLEQELMAQPDDAGLQSRRASYLAKSGDHEQALSIVTTLNLTEQRNPALIYRVALTYEVCGQRSEALDALGQAFAAGYPVAESQRDPELLELRTDPGYHRLTLDDG